MENTKKSFCISSEMLGGLGATITLTIEGTINLKKVNRDLYKGLIDLTVLACCEDKTWEGLLKAARKVQYSICNPKHAQVVISKDSNMLKGMREYSRALTKESKDFRALYKIMKHEPEKSKEDFFKDVLEAWDIIDNVRKENDAIESFKALMAELFPNSEWA